MKFNFWAPTYLTFTAYGIFSKHIFSVFVTITYDVCNYLSKLNLPNTEFLLHTFKFQERNLQHSEAAYITFIHSSSSRLSTESISTCLSAFNSTLMPKTNT